MIIMIHQNPARIDRNELLVDRKFHLGMLAFATALEFPILTVHPELPDTFRIMDAIRVPVSDLPYRILTLEADQRGGLTPAARELLRQRISESRLVYGQDFGGAEMALQLGVPYVMLVEYDLHSQIVTTTSQVTSPVRQLVRAARCQTNYFLRQRAEIRRALAVHCNGYPVFDQTASLNSKRLLYFDSRVSASAIIDESTLANRLAKRRSRPLRLIFSGRYEPIKGAGDVISVAAACQKRGLDIEMHVYGQGSSRAEMQRRSERAPNPGMIHIHETISFPELFEIAKSFDLFVCCHTQGDPSCSYLESFGAGLPVVGYANNMWRRLCDTSNAGLRSSVGSPDLVAANIERLASEPNLLATMTWNARNFALAHSFETEMDKRIDGIRDAYAADKLEKRRNSPLKFASMRERISHWSRNHCRRRDAPRPRAAVAGVR